MKMGESFLTRAGNMTFWLMFSQVAVFLASPLLTRLYTPEDFGALGIFIATSVILTVVSTLRYEAAILLQDKPSGETAAVGLCLLLVCVTTVATFFILSVLDVWEGMAPADTRPLVFAAGLALSVLLGGLYKTLLHVAIRRQRLTDIGITKARQNISTVLFQCFAVLALPGPTGLISGYVIGLSFGIFKLGRLLDWRHVASVINRRKQRQILVFRRYHRFFKFSLPADLLSALSLQGPVLLLSLLFGPVTSGLYVLAERIIRAPVAMISDSTGKSFLSIAVVAHRENWLKDLALFGFKPLLRLGLNIFVVIAILAPAVFDVVFGDAWGEAGSYASLLAPFFASIFIFVPVLTLLTVLQKQKHEFLFQVCLLSSILMGILIGNFFSSATLAIFFMSLAGFLTYSVFGLWALRLAGIDAKILVVTMFQELVISACGFVVIMGISALSIWWVDSRLISVGLLLATSMAYALFILRSSLQDIKTFNVTATRALHSRIEHE